MRDSTRKGMVWGAALSLFIIFLAENHARQEGMPASDPVGIILWMVASMVVCGLIARFFGGDSR